jgi:GTP cyclohydrolase IA
MQEAISRHEPALWPGRGEEHFTRLLEEVGEDPNRAGLLETPRRAWQALSYLTEGYDRNPAEVIGDAIFVEEYDEMVAVRDIEFYSLCEHHLLPFFGRTHVAYVPDGKIVGLSKLPRLLEVFSRRLQVQERLTTEFADSLVEVLQPRGVGVIIEASHLCMMMRGVEKQSSQTVTSAMRGIFKTDSRTRGEFLDLIKRT